MPLDKTNNYMFYSIFLKEAVLDVPIAKSICTCKPCHLLEFVNPARMGLGSMLSSTGAVCKPVLSH